jgi:hypothetical protein
VKPEAIELLSSTGVSSEEEMRARYHVRLERYMKDIDIEVSTLTDMARTQVLPAALAHQAMLAQSIDGVTRIKGQPPAAQVKLLDACVEEIGRLTERVDALEKLVQDLATVEEKERAHRYAYEVAPAMIGVRESHHHPLPSTRRCLSEGSRVAGAWAFRSAQELPHPDRRTSAMACYRCRGIERRTVAVPRTVPSTARGIEVEDARLTYRRAREPRRRARFAGYFTRAGPKQVASETRREVRGDSRNSSEGQDR